MLLMSEPVSPRTDGRPEIERLIVAEVEARGERRDQRGGVGEEVVELGVEIRRGEHIAVDPDLHPRDRH
jgi:hypothetical protein